MEKNLFVTFDYYNRRDFVSKLTRIKNVYKFPSFVKVSVRMQSSSSVSLLSLVSANVLLFDIYPGISRLMHTIDKKIKNTLLGTYLNIKYFIFIFFFKRVLFANPLIEKPFIHKNSCTSATLNIPFSLFQEFFIFYDKFLNLSLFYVDIFFANCENMEERELLVSNLFLL